MGIKVFDDPVGQRIKALMINYALQENPDNNYSIKSLEKSVEKTHKIVEFARQGLVDSLQAEADVLCFRRVSGDQNIPIDFISGILHAVDVITGDKTIIGNDIIN